MTFLLFPTFYEKARKVTVPFLSGSFYLQLSPLLTSLTHFLTFSTSVFLFFPTMVKIESSTPWESAPPPSQFFCKQSPGWPIHLPGQLSRSAYLPPSSVEVCNTAVKLHNNTVHSLVGVEMTAFVFTVNDVTILYTIAGGGDVLMMVQKYDSIYSRFHSWDFNIFHLVWRCSIHYCTLFFRKVHHWSTYWLITTLWSLDCSLWSLDFSVVLGLSLASWSVIHHWLLRTSLVSGYITDLCMV